MAKLLEQLASQYDVVLIDTPPLLPVTDAAILATITGGALAVAGAGLLHRLQLADGGDGPGADASHPRRHSPVLAAVWPAWEH